MPRILKRRSNQISRDSPHPDEEDEQASDEEEEQIRPGPSRRARLQQAQQQRKGKQRAVEVQAEDSDEEAEEDESEAEGSEDENYTGANARSRGPNGAAEIADLLPESQEGRAQSQTSILVKKLVRLALATEYSRTPLRRTDITAKIFRDAAAGGGTTTTNGATSNNATQSGTTTSAKTFKTVFNGAQRVLQGTFGMQLVELPSREKTSLKDRRNQATQSAGGGGGGQAGGTRTQNRKTNNNGETQSSSSSSSKSWILVSTLPKPYKFNSSIMTPAKAPSQDLESSYTALYTFILALIYLNNSALADQKLERYLKRVNADSYTPLGTLDKVMARMVREGYVEKRRDTSTGEEVVEWVVGPRGKVEIGTKGVVGLVKAVYGLGGDEWRNGTGVGKEDEDELNARLSRSLGINVLGTGNVRGGESDDDDDDADGGGAEDGEGQGNAGNERGQPQEQRRRGQAQGRTADQEEERLPSRRRSGRTRA